MAYLGTKSHPQWGLTGGSNSDNLRGTVFGTMPEHGHAYSMGIRAGYYDTPGNAKLAVYGTSSGNPSGRKGYTDRFNLNSYMADSVSGQTYDNIALRSAVALQAGTKYGLAALFHGGQMAHGQDNSAQRMYRRSTSASDPPDPMGYSNSDTQTRISIWVNYEPNVKPDVPSNLSPSDGTTTLNATPTYAADFRDDNETLPNGLSSDYLNAYQIQVRSVASENDTTGTLVWDSGVVGASGAEKANRRFSMVHGGAALSLGQRYQWQSRVQDRFGAWSNWSNWTDGDFLVSGGAIVTLDGTPTGRTTSTTPAFQGKYHHVLGTSSSNVQVRLAIGGVIAAISPEIAKTVASSAPPGTAFTITWAESGFATLANGVEYSYQMRAKAGGIWSDWCAARVFKTNTRPTVPASLTPAGDAVSTTRPRLTCRATDADGDALTVSARIKTDGGSVIQTRTMSWDATLFGGAGGYAYQTISGDLASYATYRWDARASDGDLTSDWSGEARFVYAQGPVIVITAPTEGQTISTGTPTITWTVTDQQKKRVRVYRVDSGELVHDSGLLVDTINSAALPSGVLRNATDYWLTVEIVDSAPLTGISEARNFRLEYVPPAVVTGFLASPELAALDVEPSVIRLTWDTVTTPGGEFLYYRLTRRFAGQSVDQSVRLADFPSVDQNTWIDDTAPAGTDLIYSLVQVARKSSFDILSSDPAESGTRLDLAGSVLSDVRDGLSTRAVFDHVDERTETAVRDQTEINTWDGGTPWLFEGPTEYTTMQLAARLIANDSATVEQQLEGLRALGGRRADGSPVLSCYRDERGRKLFGRVRNLQITDQRLQRADIEFELTELTYSDVIVAAG